MIHPVVFDIMMRLDVGEMMEQMRLVQSEDGAGFVQFIPVSPDLALQVMHKTRYQNREFPREARHASAAWLRTGGHTCWGEPPLPEGSLPS